MSRQTNSEQLALPFRVHSRVLDALGASLVTDDAVAIMELVKNSYDACASKATVTFSGPDTHIDTITIEDNGHGMTRDVIAEAWCVVATPYRVAHNYTCPDGRRRVSGEKGLGRLSASRLGGSLTLLTKAPAQKAWKLSMDWEDLAAKSIADWSVSVEHAKDFDKPTGTTIHIGRLRRAWLIEDIADIEKSLARLISPWGKKDKFEIEIRTPWATEPFPVETHRLFRTPTYTIKGKVDNFGGAKATYAFESNRRKEKISFPTVEVVMVEDESGVLCPQPSKFGPYSFEIRAWDMDKESVIDLNQRFNLDQGIQETRRLFRDSAFSGISLYRDGVLVLPKSAKSQDWLELEKRRVSQVGRRLNRSQVMGVIEITAEQNPGIGDTSDREGLVHGPASDGLYESILSIVAHLESERDKDRPGKRPSPPKANDLLSDLRDDDVVEEVREAIKAEQPLQAERAVERYVKKVKNVADQVEQRLYRYNRFAALGHLAAFLQHEVGNHTLAIEVLVHRVAEIPDLPSRTAKLVEPATVALRSLKRLAKIFGPLASSPRARKKDSNMEEMLNLCLDARREVLQRAHIEVELPHTTTQVAIDPGELTTILYNLLDNAIYWLTMHNGERNIRIERKVKSDRVVISVHDSGPGIEEGDEESIFWPGITKRPDGLGMGLTISSELVEASGGSMKLRQPGKLGGASFIFDVPLAGDN